MPALALLSHPRRSIQVGAVLFAVGLLFLIGTVIPYFFGVDNRPLWVNLGCMLAPTGFVVLIVSAVRLGREAQRAVLAELYPEAPSAAR